MPIEVSLSTTEPALLGMLECFGNLYEGLGWPVWAQHALHYVFLLRVTLESVIADEARFGFLGRLDHDINRDWLMVSFKFC